MAVGMSYVMANGDVDLSVGAVLALSGSTAAFLMKFMGWAPLPAGLAGFAAGSARGLRQRPARDPAAAAGLRGDAGHVLHRPRPRRLAGGRAAAQPVPRELQPDRPQADRDPQGAGRRAGAGRPRGSTSPARSRPRASCWCVLARRRRHRAGQDPHRLHGVRHRRQPARRRLCRHRHRQGAVLEPRVLLRLRLAGRADLHRLFPLVQPVGRAAARARRDRGRDHRRGLDLRRLRLDHRRARRGRGDHAAARPAVAADHPARRHAR